MQTTKKILFISYDGMTDPLGQSQVIPYLQGLSKKGLKFYLLSCEKPEAYAKNKELVTDLLSGYDIEWIPIQYTKKPPVVSTLIDLVRLRKKATQIYKEHHIELVHTRPGIPALIGLWMKKKFGIKFIHDIREFWADSRVDGGLWNIKNPLFNIIYKYFKRRESEQVAMADGIVCLTHAAGKITAESPEYKKGTPLQIVPCSADLDLFDPAKITATQKQELRKELGITENDLVISFLGSIGGWFLRTELLQFGKLLYDKNPQLSFLFICPDQHEVIKAEAAKLGLPANKIVTKKASRREVPVLLSLSNYSAFFIKPCFSKLSTSPTKHGEAMAMGIPVIANDAAGDVKYIIEKFQSGFVVNDLTSGSFNTVIDQIMAGHSFDPAAIRKGAEEFYSLEKAVEKYYDLYKKVLK